MIAALVGAWASPAQAAPPAELRVAGAPAGCPDVAEVAVAVGELLRGTRVSADGRVPGAPEVVVEDLGGRYAVTLAGVRREIVDERRDCADRTRVVAVLVAVALDPPSVPLQLRDRELPVGLGLTGAAGRRRRPALRFELAAGARVDGPSGGAPAAAGGTARAFIGARGLGVGLGFTGMGPVRLSLATGAARVRRLITDVGAWGALRRGRVEGTAEAGLAVSLLLVSGEELPVNWSWRGPELAVRMAGSIRVWLANRIAPFVSMEVVVVPVPHDLAVEGAGTVGRLPRSWLGGVAGLAVSLH